MKIITLTAEQKAQFATLNQDIKTAQAPLQAAHKALVDYTQTVLGTSKTNHVHRPAQLSDDGNFLIQQ